MVLYKDSLVGILQNSFEYEKQGSQLGTWQEFRLVVKAKTLVQT